MESAKQQGMGAIPFDKGVAFRVWAPHAESVSVIGEFNDWKEDASPMEREENPEFWYAEVPEAKIDQEYKYAIGKERLLKLDPYSRQVTSTSGNSIIQPWPPELVKGPLSPSDFGSPTWNDMVILEIHIGTFNQKDGQGTFASAMEKLPALAKIGINTVEVMPIAAFPEKSSQGYDPALLFAVEGGYGGSKGFAEFIQCAHENGISVILDVVYNHFGPNDLDGCLWRFDGWSENEGGGIYFYQDWRSATPWGEKNRPDYGRDEVRQYLRDNALHWIEQFEVDGLRFDSVSHIRNVFGNNDDPEHDLPDGWSLLQWINEEISQRNPWKITIAEDLLHNEWVTRATDLGGAGFGSQWDIGFGMILREALGAVRDEERDMEGVLRVIRQIFDEDAFSRVIYTESHDDADEGHGRIPRIVDPGNPESIYAKKRSLLGAVAVMTSPGVPMLLQGQMMFEAAPFDDVEGLDWSNEKRFPGITRAYSDLIQLRRDFKGFTRGLMGQGVNAYLATPGLVVIHRFDHGGPGDDVVIALNFTEQGFGNLSIGFPRPGLWHVRFNSDWKGYCPDFGDWFSYDTEAGENPVDGMPCQGNIGLGPYSAIILSQ